MFQPESYLPSILLPLTENMSIYDDIDADVMRNYQEFALVNIIYLALKESSTSEQSARMTAMDSASKNACKALDFQDNTFYIFVFQGDDNDILVKLWGFFIFDNFVSL